MMLPTLLTPEPSAAHKAPAPAAAQQVVIVNGSAEILGLLNTVLEAGPYDIVFVESNEHAYSHIKRLKPNLVILFVRIEEPGGFHVLSMLKLDEDTRAIPVLTFTTEFEGHEAEDEESAEPFEPEMFQAKAVIQMH